MEISIIINTYNASKHLREVVKSAQGFNETIICDMESTDDTVAIAKELGCKVVIFPKNNCTIVEPARNFAISQAKGPWVLVVDADEIIPPQLKEYLYQRIKQPNCPSGLYIPRKNYFMGTFMRCFYPDHLLRFFKKEGTVWPPIIHSIPLVQGDIERIPAKREELALIHLADDSVTEIIRKFNDYTDNEIERKKHKNYGVAALFHRPFVRFFKAYIIKGGIKDGKEGFIRAMLDGYYQFLMVSKIIEQRKKDNKKKQLQ